MVNFSAKKLNPSEINNGNEYTKDDRVSIEVLNGLVNSALYSQGVVDNIANMGTYSQSTTYKILNIVNYEGSSYMAIKDGFSNKTPSTNTEYWKKIAEKGEKGDSTTPSIKIGTVTNVASSTSPTVTNVGTSTNVVLDFKIPQAGISIGDTTTIMTLAYYTNSNYDVGEVTLYFDTNTYSYSSTNGYRIMSCDLTSVVKNKNIFNYGAISIAEYGLIGKEVIPFLTNIKTSGGEGAINAFSVAYVKDWGQINIRATTSSAKTYGFKLLLFVKD